MTRAWALLAVVSACKGSPPRAEPHAVPGPAAPRAVVQIAADDDTTCARHRDGTVSCWGTGASQAAATTRPVRVAGIEDARALRLAMGTGYAVQGDGTVVTFSGPDDPARPTGHRTDGPIFATGSMLCTQDAAGRLGCTDGAFSGVLSPWGADTGPTRPPIDALVESYLPEVCWLVADGPSRGKIQCARAPAPGTAEAARSVDTLALPGPATTLVSRTCPVAGLADGRVVTWCDGTTDAGVSTTLRVVPGVHDAVAVAIGAYKTCVVTGDEAVWCWWHDPFRARLHGAQPQPVPGLAHPVEVAVGRSHACARLADGTVRCWGAGDRGQRGDGVSRPAPDDYAPWDETPTPVALPPAR